MTDYEFPDNLSQLCLNDNILILYISARLISKYEEKSQYIPADQIRLSLLQLCRIRNNYTLVDFTPYAVYQMSI